MFRKYVVKLKANLQSNLTTYALVKLCVTLPHLHHFLIILLPIQICCKGGTRLMQISLLQISLLRFFKKFQFDFLSKNSQKNRTNEMKWLNIHIRQIFGYLMQILANANSFPEPKVALGKDSLYVAN